MSYYKGYYYYVKTVDYRCIIYYINKSEAIILLENPVLQNSGYIYKRLSDFWIGIVNMKNPMHLKKISKELMPIAWHPERWWNFCLPEDEKKEIGPICSE